MPLTVYETSVLCTYIDETFGLRATAWLYYVMQSNNKHTAARTAINTETRQSNAGRPRIRAKPRSEYGDLPPADNDHLTI